VRFFRTVRLGFIPQEVGIYENIKAEMEWIGRRLHQITNLQGEI
jgi:hypothetical protein